MSKNILNKIIVISVLAAMSYASVSAAAPVTQFTFNTTIQEIDEPWATSPLTTGDSISGDIQFDHNVLTFQDTGSPDMRVFAGAGVDTSGLAQSASAGWQQGPFYILAVVLQNDQTVTQGYLDSLPTFANTTNFSDLPSVDDAVDIVDITAYEYTGGPQQKIFSLDFVFSSADNVVTGSTLADVDFTKLFTNLIFGKFSAGEYTDLGEKVWDASGPLYKASPVPIPAAVWLFGSGLLGLIGLGKRRPV
ncbi:MAG: hypothetical protein P8Z39_02490 [Gammaproteobacteria bacterium]